MVENTNVVEKKENKKKRGLIVILAALLMGSTVAGNLFGYWTESVTAPNQNQVDNNLVTIGTGNGITGDLEVTQEFTVSNNLVPNGRISHSVGSNNVESFTQDLTTRWKDDTNVVKVSDNVRGTLKIAARATFQDGNSNGEEVLNRLLNIAIKAKNSQENMINDGKTIVLQGDTIESTLTVTLTEPANKSEYDQIKGRGIKIHLTYTVENVQN